jgi:hypothetical protein
MYALIYHCSHSGALHPADGTFLAKSQRGRPRGSPNAI